MAGSKRCTTAFDFGACHFRPVDARDQPALVASGNLPLEGHTDPDSLSFMVSDLAGPIGHVGLDVRSTTSGELRPLAGPGRAQERPNPTISTLAMLWLGFERLGLEHVYASIPSGDEPAIRACEAAGFVKMRGDIDGFDHYVASSPARQAGAFWDAPGVAADIARYWTHQDERFHRAWLAGEILRALPRATCDILEAGCGAGLVYDALLTADRGACWQYAGIDRSYQMLAHAVRSHPSAAFRAGDLFALPPGAADVIVCCEVLGHTPDFERAIEILVRAARSRFIVSLWVGEPCTSEEQIAGARFSHHVYSRTRIDEAIRRVMPDATVHETYRESVGLFRVDTSRG